MARPAYSDDERDRIEAQIRAAALGCFAREGYRATSMRLIAAELGWSAPALYRYFQSKEALLAAVRAEGFRALGERLAALRTPGRNAVDTLRAAMASYLAFSREQPDLYQLMYELDQGELAEHQDVVKCRRAAFAQAEAMAYGLLEQRGITGNANRIAHLFWINVHGLAALAVANQLDLGQSFDELVEPVIKMITDANLAAEDA